MKIIRKKTKAIQTGAIRLDSDGVFYFFLGMLFLYLYGISFLGMVSKSGFEEAQLFPDQCHGFSGLISVLTFLSGFLLLFFIPGYTFLLNLKGARFSRSAFLAFSFMGSIGILIVSTTVFKFGTHREIGRGDLVVLIALAMLSGWGTFKMRTLNGRDKTLPLSFRLSELRPFLALFFTVLIYFMIFYGTIIGERTAKNFDFSPHAVLSIPLGSQTDDFEVFGLADSLKRHLLPYWDMEYADQFGFVFTDFLFPYITSPATILFGQNYESLTLLSLVFIVILFSVILSQGQGGRLPRFFICSVLLIAYLLFFKNEDSVFILPQHLFTLLIFLSYDFLLNRNYGGFLSFSVLTSLMRFYGIVFILLGLAGVWIFYQDRRSEIVPVVKGYFTFILALVLFVAGIAVGTGNGIIYEKWFLVEYFNRVDYGHVLHRWFPQEAVFLPKFSLKASFQFLRWCLYGTAFLFPFIFIFGNDRQEKFYSFVGIVYFISVFFSTYQLSRYIIPLIPLVAIVMSIKTERIVKRIKNSDEQNFSRL